MPGPFTAPTQASTGRCAGGWTTATGGPLAEQAERIGLTRSRFYFGRCSSRESPLRRVAANFVTARPAPAQLLGELLDRQTLWSVKEVGRAPLLHALSVAALPTPVAVTGPGERCRATAYRHAGEGS